MAEPPLKKRKSRFGAKVTAETYTAEQMEKRQAALEVAAKLGLILGDSGGGGDGAGGGGGFGYQGQQGGVTEKMPVPADKVGAVIGRGGAKIKEIQEVTQTRMQVARDGDPNTPHLRDVTITGARENVEKAKEMVRVVLEETNRYSGTFQEGRESKTIEVPANNVGLIIGRGGETIRRIKSESGCSINVERDEYPQGGPPARPGFRNVHIKGLPENIAQAEQAIFALVESADRGGRGRGGYNQYNNRNQQQGYQQPPPYNNQQGGYQPNNAFQPPTGYGQQPPMQQPPQQQPPPVWQQQQGNKSAPTPKVGGAPSRLSGGTAAQVQQSGFQQPPPQQQPGTYDPFRPLDQKFSKPPMQQENAGGPLNAQPQQNYSTSNFPPNQQAPGGPYQPQFNQGGHPPAQQDNRPPQQLDRAPQGGPYGSSSTPKDQYRPYNSGQQEWSAPRQQETQYQRENPPQQSDPPQYRDERRPNTDFRRDNEQGPGRQFGEQGGNFEHDRRGNAPSNSYGTEQQYRPPTQRPEGQYQDQRGNRDPIRSYQ